MNVFLSIKNKQHKKKYNDNSDDYTTQSLHKHVILGISILPLSAINQYLLIQHADYSTEQIVFAVTWILLFVILLLVGLLVSPLQKRLKKRRSLVRFCLDIFYTSLAAFLAYLMYRRARIVDHLEIKFATGWFGCQITIAIFEIISRWYLKLISTLAVVCFIFCSVYKDTSEIRMIITLIQLAIYYVLSIYFTHRDTIKRFLEKQKTYDEAQIFKEILDQTTDGILIYGLQEGKMYRNWEDKKKYSWWNEQQSVEENLKAIKVEQKKTHSDYLISARFNTEAGQSLAAPDESTLSGLLESMIRSINTGIISNLDETHQTHNLMIIKGRFECHNKEDGNNVVLSEEVTTTLLARDKITANLLEIKVMALIFREKPALALIFHDITERSMIDLLEDNNNYKNRLLASVSHELRTPLNASINLVQAAVDDPRIPIALKEDLLIPSLDSNRLLLYLINDILDFSQMSANKLRLVFEKSDIKGTIEDCLNLIKMQVKRKSLSLETDITIETSTSQFCTDHNRLKQIILNLLSNAIKFTLEGGIKITLKLTPSEEYHRKLYVEVSDTGIGISKENQKRLFKVYEKIELGRRTSLNSTGVGLGLVISNNLVQLLGPDEKNQSITVESELNKGSKFSFCIVDKTSQEILNQGSRMDTSEDHNVFMDEILVSKSQSHQTLLVPNFDSASRFEVKNIFSKYRDSNTNDKVARCDCPRILVVDDDVFNITALQTILSKFGFKSETAYNGQLAINKIRQRQDHPCSENCHQFELVFMDCNMPILDGFEAAKRLKEMMSLRRISSFGIIGCTAMVQTHELQRAIECGMNDCCTKPLDRDKIGKFLKSFVVD